MKIDADLPELTLSHHARAKRLKLAVSPKGIRLTLPPKTTQRQVQNFLQASLPWLKETWQQQKNKNDAQLQSLPMTLSLFNRAALKVVYQIQKKSYVFAEDSHTVFINQQRPEQALKAFVTDYAKFQLPKYLQQVANETKLTFKESKIRQTKTRWGSCTSTHRIMLNSSLVFLPVEIVRYVCVHELVHTQHFNHSPAFWATVQQHDAYFQDHQKQLKMVALPYWW